MEKEIKDMTDLCFRDLLEDALTQSDVQSKMRQWDDVMIDAMECIKEYNPEKYEKLYMWFYKINMGSHFNYDLANLAIAKMKNVDGTKGVIWDCKTVETLAMQKGILPSPKYNKYDVYYIANMYASDNWDVSMSDEDNTDLMFKLTKNFLNDPDGVDGRAFRFYTKVANWHPKK